MKDPDEHRAHPDVNAYWQGAQPSPPATADASASTATIGGRLPLAITIEATTEELA